MQLIRRVHRCGSSGALTGVSELRERATLSFITIYWKGYSRTVPCESLHTSGGGGARVSTYEPNIQSRALVCLCLLLWLVFCALLRV